MAHWELLEIAPLIWICTTRVKVCWYLYSSHSLFGCLFGLSAIFVCIDTAEEVKVHQTICH